MRRLFVANAGEDSISVLNPAKLREVDRIPLGGGAVVRMDRETDQRHQSSNIATKPGAVRMWFWPLSLAPALWGRVVRHNLIPPTFAGRRPACVILFVIYQESRPAKQRHSRNLHNQQRGERNA